MKNCLFKYKSHLATAFIGLCLVSTGCTDKFEEINTDPKGVDDSVTDMVDKIQSPLDNIIPPQEHRYQLWANLTTDIFAGFMMGVNDFGGSNNYNFNSDRTIVLRHMMTSIYMCLSIPANIYRSVKHWNALNWQP